jgi:hypothetical protein
MVDGMMLIGEETDLKEFSARCLSEEEFKDKVANICNSYYKADTYKVTNRK